MESDTPPIGPDSYPGRVPIRSPTLPLSDLIPVLGQCPIGVRHSPYRTRFLTRLDAVPYTRSESVPRTIGTCPLSHWTPFPTLSNSIPHPIGPLLGFPSSGERPRVLVTTERLAVWSGVGGGRCGRTHGWRSISKRPQSFSRCYHWAPGSTSESCRSFASHSAEACPTLFHFSKDADPPAHPRPEPPDSPVYPGPGPTPLPRDDDRSDRIPTLSLDDPLRSGGLVSPTIVPLPFSASDPVLCGLSQDPGPPPYLILLRRSRSWLQGPRSTSLPGSCLTETQGPVRGKGETRVTSFWNSPGRKVRTDFRSRPLVLVTSRSPVRPAVEWNLTSGPQGRPSVTCGN